MSEKNEQLEAARKAKTKVLALFSPTCAVSSVGITRRGGAYAVKLNLEREPEVPIPDEVDGVPLVVHVVGEIRKQAD